MRADRSAESEYAANDPQKASVVIRVPKTRKTSADRDTRGPPRCWAVMGARIVLYWRSRAYWRLLAGQSLRYGRRADELLVIKRTRCVRNATLRRDRAEGIATPVQRFR